MDVEDHFEGQIGHKDLDDRTPDVVVVMDYSR